MKYTGGTLWPATCFIDWRDSISQSLTYYYVWQGAGQGGPRVGRRQLKKCELEGEAGCATDCMLCAEQ
jgi:hypothetical protein